VIWFWLFLREQSAVGYFDLAFSLRVSVSPCLRERMAVWLFGYSSASPRSPREKRMLDVLWFRLRWTGFSRFFPNPPR
jgi:hypothetical protein